jgi:anti-sigma regulatory factor (Ser/Thr protein kinase)
MPPLQRTRPTFRVGHVYADVPRRSLRFLNAVAEQLHKEGVPMLAADFAAGTLRTLGGEAAQPADLPLYLAWREARPAEAEFLLARPGGGVWHVTWSASPIHGPDTQLEGVLGTVTCGPRPPDPDRLAELSHDLRTPLQSLRLQCTLLEQVAASGGDVGPPLAVLKSATDRAVQIAMELLDCCRGPAPRPRTPAASWFALAPFLRGLGDEQAAAARAKGLALTMDLAAAHGWEAHSDPVRLGRLLANLLVNAVRYTPRGGIALRTAWGEEQGERRLEVSVSDTGPGIADEEQESIFQPYERGRAGQEGDSSGDSGGSGLGLAVVERLVEELGLRVEVDSIWGRGSTFTVLIPLSLLRQP